MMGLYSQDCENNILVFKIGDKICPNLERGEKKKKKTKHEDVSAFNSEVFKTHYQ
jgi:hypothetical protein